MSAHPNSYTETWSTLVFAQRYKLLPISFLNNPNINRTKHIKNKAVVNESSSGTVMELKQEVERLKSLLSESLSRPTLRISQEEEVIKEYAFEIF